MDNTSDTEIKKVNSDINEFSSDSSLKDSKVIVDSDNSVMLDSEFDGSDEALLKAFVGSQYEKFKNQKFNIGAFFFTTIYLFYRKMFLYGILIFIINIVVSSLIKFPAISLVLSVLMGLFINKFYLSFAAKKVAKLKEKNPQMDNEQLKYLCVKKGGTGFGLVIAGFFVEFITVMLIIVVSLLLGFGSAFKEFLDSNIIYYSSTNEKDDNEISNNEHENVNNDNAEDIESNDSNDIENSINDKIGKKLEDVNIGTYVCIDNECQIYIGDDFMVCDLTINEKLELFKDYDDYLKINIYYEEIDSNKKVIGYEVYSKSNNKDITNIKTEAELREALGFLVEGNYTEKLIFVEMGSFVMFTIEEEDISYQELIFKDADNKEYQILYNVDKEIELKEGSTYTVTFDVKVNDLDNYVMIASKIV